MNRVIVGIVIAVLGLLIFAQLAFSYNEAQKKLDYYEELLPTAIATKLQDGNKPIYKDTLE